MARIPEAEIERLKSEVSVERLVVPAGEHRITVRLSDDVRARDTAYQHESTVTLVPGQVLVIDFDAGKGGITLN